jgi:hypothetical protein
VQSVGGHDSSPDLLAVAGKVGAVRLFKYIKVRKIPRGGNAEADRANLGETSWTDVCRTCQIIASDLDLGAGVMSLPAGK